MTQSRSRSRHAKRLAAALCSTFVAAGAMAYATGGLQQHHPKDASDKPAAGSGAHGGGGTVLESQAEGSDSAGGGDSDSGAGGGAGGGGFTLADGAPHGAFGPGEDHDGPKADGFIPNGENGLMMLADLARRGAEGGGDNNSGHTPGLSPAGLGAQDGGDDAVLPFGAGGGPAAPGGEGDTSKLSGGFGVPGFGGGGGGYAGGGFGGGGGGSGGGIGSPAGSTGGAGGDGSGPLTGGQTNPLGGDPQTGPQTGSQTGPQTGPTAGGGDSPPVTVCVVTALNSCGLTPTDGGPKTQGPLGPTVGSPTTSQDIAQIGTPVPEASTWLLMIVGFGGAGALLRARRHGEPRGTPA